MFGVVVGQTVANLATAPLNIIIGLAWGESIAMQSIVISFCGRSALQQRRQYLLAARQTW